MLWADWGNLGMSDAAQDLQKISAFGAAPESQKGMKRLYLWNEIKHTVRVDTPSVSNIDRIKARLYQSDCH